MARKKRRMTFRGELSKLVGKRIGAQTSDTGDMLWGTLASLGDDVVVIRVDDEERSIFVSLRHLTRISVGHE